MSGIKSNAPMHVRCHTNRGVAKAAQLPIIAIDSATLFQIAKCSKASKTLQISLFECPRGLLEKASRGNCCSWMYCIFQHFVATGGATLDYINLVVADITWLKSCRENTMRECLHRCPKLVEHWRIHCTYQCVCMLTEGDMLKNLSKVDL